MILDANAKQAISDIRMEKAREFLGDARAALAEGRLRTSVNRAYYSALNAVRSLLALEGANPGTHEGIVTLLSLKFVKPGIVPVDVVKKFKTLLSRRTDVDYGDFDTIDAAEAQDSLQSAERILEISEETRQRMRS